MPVDGTFVDTNVLVYAGIASAPWQSDQQQTLETELAAGRDRWVSRQVLREYAAVRSRPQTWAEPIAGPALVERIRWIEARFQVADDTAAVTERLVALVAAFAFSGASVHDANLVATMQVVGVRQLLTQQLPRR